MNSVWADERTELFTSLFREFVPSVRGYVRTLVADSDVETVVQATFETAWSKLDLIPRMSQRAWLFGVARNHVRNHFRAERRRASLTRALVASRPAEELELSTHEPDAAELSSILVALDGLSADERELIQLLAWHEMNPVEIALVLGISGNAARVRVHRARRRLSTLLAAADREVAT